MSVRARITLFVLLVSLAQAILLGVIGYNSVATVSRNAGELRRIVTVMEGARDLSSSLIRLSDPGDFLLGGMNGVPGLFAARMEDVERRVRTCAASTCHGYAKRPPAMARSMAEDLRRLKAEGVGILAVRAGGGGGGTGAGGGVLQAWLERVDAPIHRLSHMTGEMSETLSERAKEIEASSKKAERWALFLIGAATLFCVLVAVGLCSPTAREIASPLERLADQSRLVATGGTARRVEESGPLEAVALARAFNRMQEDLARNREDLLGHQARLERTVEERIAELRRKDEELKRTGRLAGIGLIAGTVAHNLNNPLTSLLLNADLLSEALHRDHPDRGVVDDLMKDARRCRQIAAELRALSRETGIEKVPCAVEGIVEEAVRLLRFRWEPRRISVGLEFPAVPRRLLCAPAEMLQLLVNLLENAIDASPDGGSVDVRVRTEGDSLVVEVEDRGHGIPPEHRESMFRMLFTTKQEGTGLGLAICRRIVEQHEGTIGFETRTPGESPEAHGTRFRVVLPPGGEEGGAQDG